MKESRCKPISDMLSWLSLYIKPQDFRKQYQELKKHLFDENFFENNHIDNTLKRYYRDKDKQAEIYKHALDI